MSFISLSFHTVYYCLHVALLHHTDIPLDLILEFGYFTRSSLSLGGVIACWFPARPIVCLLWGCRQEWLECVYGQLQPLNVILVGHAALGREFGGVQGSQSVHCGDPVTDQVIRVHGESYEHHELPQWLGPDLYGWAETGITKGLVVNLTNTSQIPSTGSLKWVRSWS